ncbi:glutamate ABC transporter substrate-binding protein [Streptomyces capparidis]
MKRRGVGSGAVALALAAVAAVPSSGPGGTGPARTAAPAARPAAGAAPAVPAEEGCDRLASLRPTGALPPPGGRMPAGSTMERIRERGRLIAGVDQNTYLWGYRDPATGDIEGFDIDLVREVARAILGDPDRVEYRTLPSSERLTAVAEGRVDIVAHSVTITCERKRHVAFTADYFHDGQRVLVRRDSAARTLADLAGRRVCSARGTTSIEELARARPAVRPVAATEWTDCLVLLQLGEVEAVSTTEHVLQGLMAQDPETKIVGPVFTFEPHGLVVAKENADLVRFANAVLDRMRRNGHWERVYERWMGRFGPVPEPPVPRYR